MIRTCDEDDVRATLFGEPTCGRTYDDVDHLTYCPHDPLPPKLTPEERDAELDRLFGTRWRDALLPPQPVTPKPPTTEEPF